MYKVKQKEILNDQSRSENSVSNNYILFQAMYSNLALSPCRKKKRKKLHKILNHSLSPVSLGNVPHTLDNVLNVLSLSDLCLRGKIPAYMRTLRCVSCFVPSEYKHGEHAKKP